MSLKTMEKQKSNEVPDVETRSVKFSDKNELQQQDQCETKQEEDQEEIQELEEPPEQPPLTHARKYTNVTFPRGFSPSQCSLLATRQRSANYLYFSANELGELQTNQNSSQSDKKIRKKKKKVRFSKSHVTNSAHTGHGETYESTVNHPGHWEISESSEVNHVNNSLHPGQLEGSSRNEDTNQPHPGLLVSGARPKPVLPVSNRNESSSARFRLAKLENKASSETGLMSSSRSPSKDQTGSSGFQRYLKETGQTGQTSQIRWQSNKDIARTLSAHVHSLLRIPSGEILREVERVERTIKYSGSRSGFPPKSPVYLFGEKTGSLKSTERHSKALK